MTIITPKLNEYEKKRPRRGIGDFTS